MKQKIIKSLKKKFRLQIPLLLPEIANKIKSFKVENIIYQQKTADGSAYYVEGVTGL
jgi:hypothetical protein